MPDKGFLRRAFEAVLRSGRAARETSRPPDTSRRWRLLQIESALQCHLDCVMCPWHDMRGDMVNEGLLTEEIWQAIVPHLPQIAEIDFSGGGEALLQPNLIDWVAQAHAAGTRVGFLTNAYYLDEETSRRLIDAGLDWLATSIDGATAEKYEEIRINSSFERICKQLRAFTRMRRGTRPNTMVNFVLMERNRSELRSMVKLVSKLGLDQLNIKQADVIRGDHGKGAGLFAREETREIRAFQKEVDAAVRLGRELGIKVETAPFTPRERPICAQQPNQTMFVRYDGLVSACISLAYGGPTSFFGEDAMMPTVEYGRLPQQDLLQIWEGDVARRYRGSFEARSDAYDAALDEGAMGESQAALDRAIHHGLEAMPEALEGCRNCHYLYGV